MNKLKLYALNLTLFDEGAAAPGPSVEGTVGSDSQQKQAAPKVVYGKQDDTQTATPIAKGAETKAPVEQPVDRRSEFEKMIKGDYKAEFNERTQGIIDQRFKASKQVEAQLQATAPILDSLYSRYNVEPGDIQNLTRAMDNDHALWEEQADSMGLTVEQYKNFKTMERENADLKKMQQQAEQRQQADQTYNAWMQQAEEMKAEYPGFNLDAEVQNRDFLGMLRANVPVKVAYEAAHMGEIKQNVAKSTAKQTEANVTSSIRANGQRPTEAGTAQQSGIIVKNDVSKFTKADRAEIAKRVNRGENVNL